jgi:heat shock protein HtpX
MIFCLVWGMTGAFISLLLSRSLVKWMLGVTLINPETANEEEKFLLQAIKKLADDAGLEKAPQMGIYPSNEVNAFATGATKKQALIAVSSGLLKRMDQKEILAILGHEMSHVINGDMVTMTLLQGIINAFVMFLARILAFFLSSHSSRNKNESSYGSFWLFSYLFEWIFMILGSMVIAAYSRRREFEADAGGAHLVGKDKMISALKSLRVLKEIKDPKTQPVFQSFKISSPAKKGFLYLFSTHPTLEERIDRLERS